MRRSTHRQRREQSRRSSAAPPRGPLGPVTSRPEFDQAGSTDDPSTSMTSFFEYLHDHKGTTELAKAMADVVMLRTTGARPDPARGDHERIAS